MTEQAVHVADIGTLIEVTVMDGAQVVDISGCTTRQIYLQKPSGSVLQKTASLSGDGTDGKMRYVSQSGDFDQHGFWYVQAYVVFPSGKEWHTTTESFPVHPNLA